MSLRPSDFRAIRLGIAEIPGDVSSDAVGHYAPKLEDMFAPETHAAALDPSTPIVVGSRGTGKSFWAGVLGQGATKKDAAKAYPKLRLQDVNVYFGFTGIGGSDGIGADALNSIVPENADLATAKAFWWATVLRAAARSNGNTSAKLSDLATVGSNWEARDIELERHEQRLRAANQTLLIVYDALDTVATNWPRRRLITEALLEVVWATRAYRSIKLKVFVRPDQIDDDGLRFVELPKLRTGAVRLMWSGLDLYGLLYARLALAKDEVAKIAFRKLLKSEGIPTVVRDEVLTRNWSLCHDVAEQTKIMTSLAGQYMAAGTYGYKKGKTYDWPLTHLADALDEVTPRSFIGLLIAAAKHGSAPDNWAITPDGIRHGLRAASKTRVDQLHQEFPWIKAVLAPLAGLLLPSEDSAVFKAWKQSKTIQLLIQDAATNNYLLPFSNQDRQSERELFEALNRIGVMFRRKDDRIDMPDLFRVAAKLLKKGATAPL